MSGDASQDAKDGAALRQLGDVLAAQPPRFRGYTLDRNNDGSFFLSVRLEDERIIGTSGATIAEAAAMCEASLKAQQG